MTEYERLLGVFRAAAKRQDDYEAECRQFAVSIIARVRAFLGCAAENVTAHPPGTFDRETACNARSALKLEEDGFARFTTTLWFGRLDSVSWPLQFKKRGGKWEIGMMDHPAVFKVEPGTLEGLDVALRAWAAYSGNVLNTALDAVLEGRPRAPLGLRISADRERADRCIVNSRIGPS